MVVVVVQVEGTLRRLSRESIIRTKAGTPQHNNQHTEHRDCPISCLLALQKWLHTAHRYCHLLLPRDGVSTLHSLHGHGQQAAGSSLRVSWCTTASAASLRQIS